MTRSPVTTLAAFLLMIAGLSAQAASAAGSGERNARLPARARSSAGAKRSPARPAPARRTPSAETSTAGKPSELARWTRLSSQLKDWLNGKPHIDAVDPPRLPSPANPLDQIREEQTPRFTTLAGVALRRPPRGLAAQTIQREMVDTLLDLGAQPGGSTFVALNDQLAGAILDFDVAAAAAVVGNAPLLRHLIEKRGLDVSERWYENTPYRGKLNTVTLAAAFGHGPLALELLDKYKVSPQPTGKSDPSLHRLAMRNYDIAAYSGKSLVYPQ